MAIHVQPISELVRMYKKGTYEERSKYDAVATIVYEGLYTVSIQGLNGSISRDDLRELRDYLRRRGVSTIKMERRGVCKIIRI